MLESPAVVVGAEFARLLRWYTGAEEDSDDEGTDEEDEEYDDEDEGDSDEGFTDDMPF
jgi:hypothetical protein